jgi:hypothetical protein
MVKDEKMGRMPSSGGSDRAREAGGLPRKSWISPSPLVETNGAQAASASVMPAARTLTTIGIRFERFAMIPLPAD